MEVIGCKSWQCMRNVIDEAFADDGGGVRERGGSVGMTKRGVDDLNCLV